MKKQRPITFHKKLVAHFSMILLLATVIVGLAGFLIAKNALNNKGQQMLENSVRQAIDLIEVEYQQVENGNMSTEDAQETVKTILMGPLNPDGTRKRESKVDLGEYGYFIIYDSEGNEVMHPSLEGQNVWYTVDARNKTRHIVQEQIQIAKENGGFMNYYWVLPDSDKIEQKFSYAMYYEKWDWIVVATSYASEFNSEANHILFTLFGFIVIIVGVIVYMINRYLNGYTKPISQLIHGMEMLEDGTYCKVEADNCGEEIGRMVTGYNKMIYYLEETHKSIQSKNKKITYLAYHDEMTQLPNFYGMEHHLNKRIAGGAGNAALILINVRGLNVVNAVMGYDKGNKLLKDIGLFLSERTNEFYSARTSSNEFGLWMEKDSFQLLIPQLEQFKKILRNYLEEEGYGITADFYFAVALYPDNGKSFEELYETATLAMKHIKDTVGVNIGIYQSNMRGEIEGKIELFQELSKAMEEGEIIPFYQEKTDFVEGKVIGVEALARWKSPKWGMVSPAVFIPAIHELNLTHEFTEYMLRRALSDYGKLCEKYEMQIDLAININPSSFLNSNLFHQVKQALMDYQVPSGKLILEITEDVFISDIQAIQEITNKLHQIGVRIAIDDFGTGYSSLNSLAQIDFDELKIDKSFFDKILTDEKVFELVMIFCEIARVYDYEIVAEGIESTEQLELLKDTRLRIIQGYLFSKPEPLE